MIDIKIALGFMIIIIAIIAVCAFAGLWLGAYIHHRGVSVGSGSRESFTGEVPTGEVFRISSSDDLPDEPDVQISETLDKTVAARADRFLSTVMGKGAMI